MTDSIALNPMHSQSLTQGNLTDPIFVFLLTLSQEKASHLTAIQVMQKMVQLARSGTMKKTVLVTLGHSFILCSHLHLSMS